MRDLSLALDLAGHAQQPTGDDDLADGLIRFAPDDDIGDASLVLQRQEDHAGCGARTLAGKTSHFIRLMICNTSGWLVSVLLIFAPALLVFLPGLR